MVCDDCRSNGPHATCGCRDQRFDEGQHVILLAVDDEPEGSGTILEYEGDGMYLVREHGIHDLDDDGTREVHEDQISEAA